MAELVLNGKTAPDISCLALDRFKEPIYQEERCFF